MSSQITMKNIPNTTLNVFCSIAKEKNDYDILFVYIFKILLQGKLVVVKPITSSNPESESLQGVIHITSKKILAGIEERADGIFFRVYEGLSASLSRKVVRIHVLNNDNTIDLGQIKGCVPQNDIAQAHSHKLYDIYVKLSLLGYFKNRQPSETTEKSQPIKEAKHQKKSNLLAKFNLLRKFPRNSDRK